MTLKLIILSCVFTFAGNVHAQAEKGFLFTIGEKILNLAGHSYLKLEQTLTSKDKDLAACLAEEAQSKFVLKQKEEALLACQGQGTNTTPETPPAPPATPAQ